MFKIRNIAGVLLVAVAVRCVVLVCSEARGQDKADQPDLKAFAVAWQKSMTPGREHEALARKVGNWKVEIADDLMGPHKSQATAEIKMVMGGRYQVINAKGDLMGQPFEGCSTTGFDNVRQVYLNTWIDSLGTTITTAEGKAIDDKTVEMKGKMLDPASGAMNDFRTVQKDVDADHFTYVMYLTSNGQERKVVSVCYSRAK